MIKFENVTKKFLINNQDYKVIDDLSFSVYENEIYGLVGDTASGKSTILRLMNGFIEADLGSIYLMGQKLDKNTRSQLVRDTSMIFQEFNLLNNLSVLENVVLPTKFRKDDQKKYILRAKELLNFVGLANFENSYPNTLSGGQKQRVAIARSLITKPKIIFCDEPTSALDDKMAYEILKLLKDINQSFKTTIVLVSHDISVIKALANRVGIIEDGRLKDHIEITPKKLVPRSYKEALLHD